MNKLKKLMACVCAVVMAVSMLTACGKDDSSKKTEGKITTSQITTSPNEIDYDKLVIPEKKLVIDGKEVDTTDLVVMTINDKYKVTYDQYRLFYFTAITQAEIDFSTLDEDKWDEAFKLVKDYVEDYIKRYYVDLILAEQNGVEVTEDIKNSVEVEYQKAVAEHKNEENFKKLLYSQYYTPELWKELLTAQLLYNETNEKLYGEGGTYYMSKDQFKEFAKTDDYACAKHILVTFSSLAEIAEEDKQKYDEGSLTEKLQYKEKAYDKLSEDEKKALEPKAKEKIQEILEKVKNGEDFDKLIDEYGWDPGMVTYKEGYFLTENTSFVKEFIDATFALKPGEYSDIVESSFGYHIIKRMPVEEDYIEKNLDDRYEEHYQEVMILKDSELREAILNDMKITFCDEYSKFTIDSVN